MKKILSCLMLSIFMIMNVCGCSSKSVDNTETAQKTSAKTSDDTVSLTIFCEEDTFDFTNKLLESFKNEHKDTNFKFKLVKHSDSDMKNDILRDVNANFDLFTFPDDQFDSLNASGVLSEVPNSDEIKNRNIENASNCASYNDKMYAYPYTADNGYFLYYDKSYFSDEDIKTLDRILEVCNASSKHIGMELDSGWYMYSFFGQTGLNFSINDDGLTNSCDWNTGVGLDVAKAIKAFIDNPAFEYAKSDALVEGFTNGSIIAGVSGTWNASVIKNILGDNFGAIKLPTYTCNNQQVQMSTFIGYKMIGVNSYSKNKELAHKVADYLTNENSQLQRLQELSVGPSNINVSKSDEVKNNLAISAILNESDFGIVQRVGNSYWNACTDFYNSLQSKSYNDTELQELLDTMVAEITKNVGN